MWFYGKKNDLAFFVTIVITSLGDKCYSFFVWDGEFIKIIVLACLMLAVFIAANVMFYVAGKEKKAEVNA